MLNQKGLYQVSLQVAERYAQDHIKEGGRVFWMPVGITSKKQFFEAIRNTFPLDPELVSNQSWDALSDSLWSGLEGLPEECIVIVWPDSSRFRAIDPDAFGIATEILGDLCVSLADAETTLENKKQLIVFQVI